jgi:uncharacterized membrane protein
MRIIQWICADSWRRFIVSAIAALVAFLALRDELTFPSNAIAVWDVFAAISVLIAWAAISTTPPARLREHARAQDLSRLLIFGVVVLASCVALFAVAVLIRNHHSEMQSGAGITLALCLALGTVALSWLLLHTVYSLHYAHVYYGDADQSDQRYSAAKGLDFPNTEDPDYVDFAYFSFVIGMTCQVSDVQVTSQRMRRLTLVHGVISFGFNTFILALLINTISSLL